MLVAVTFAIYIRTRQSFKEQSRLETRSRHGHIGNFSRHFVTVSWNRCRATNFSTTVTEARSRFSICLSVIHIYAYTHRPRVLTFLSRKRWHFWHFSITVHILGQSKSHRTECNEKNYGRWVGYFSNIVINLTFIRPFERCITRAREQIRKVAAAHEVFKARLNKRN